MRTYIEMSVFIAVYNRGNMMSNKGISSLIVEEV